jgi:predicted amidohydrolase
VRALLAALRCPKGDVAGNLAAHVRLLSDAASAGCDLAVFPEMSLTGSVDPASARVSASPSARGPVSRTSPRSSRRPGS